MGKGAPTAAVGLLVASTLILLALACVAAATKAYAIDEFYYAHHTWEKTRSWGAFLSTITEGTRFVTTWALAPATLFAGDSPSKMILLRLSMLPFFLGTLFLLANIAARNAPEGHRRLTALLAVFFALGLHPLSWQGLEIRPDVVGLFLFLASWSLFELEQAPRLGPIFSGLLLFLATFASIKVLVYGSVLFLFFLMDQWAICRRRAQVLGSSWWLAAGFTAGSVGLLATLALTDSLSSFWQGFYVSPKLHQQYYPPIPTRTFLVPFWHESRPILLLSALGTLWALRLAARRFAREGTVDRMLLVVALAASTSLSYVLQKAAYPYSLMPACATFAILAACGTSYSVAAFSKWADRSVVVRYGGLAILLGYLGFVFQRSTVGLTVVHGNGRQLQLQEEIGRLTHADDVAYDMSSAFFSRRGAHHLAIVDNSRLMRFGQEKITRDAMRDLVENEAVLFVYDVRFHTRWLKTELGAFISKNYQKYNNDLFVWGRRWGAEGTFNDKFWAIKSGRYFVFPPSAAGDFEVDGEPLDTPIVQLSRGAHHVRYRANWPRPPSVYFIWLPRDGRLFDPTAQHPSFYLARYILP